MSHSTTTPAGLKSRSIVDLPFSAWRAILMRTFADIGQHNIPLIAGGAAFFLFLALFPAIAAFVALYGLVLDVSAVQNQMASLSGVLPDTAIEIIDNRLTEVASSNNNALGIGFIAGLAFALWSAHGGVKALIAALNIIYREDEDRGFLKLTAVSLFFTVCAILGAATLVAAVVFVPVAVNAIGLGDRQDLLLTALRWPILFVVLVAGTSLLFRYCASRRPPRWKWVVPGSVVAAVLWVAASALFSFYLSNFARFDATYGSLGAIIGFMMWLYLSLLILLLGAELNAEIEHQLLTDTTVGPDRRLGNREAYVADHVAGSQRS